VKIANPFYAGEDDGETGEESLEDAGETGDVSPAMKEPAGDAPPPSADSSTV
jgi:hypothetical protein